MARLLDNLSSDFPEFATAEPEATSAKKNLVSMSVFDDAIAKAGVNRDDLSEEENVALDAAIINAARSRGYDVTGHVAAYPDPNTVAGLARGALKGGIYGLTLGSVKPPVDNIPVNDDPGLLSRIVSGASTVAGMALPVAVTGGMASQIASARGASPLVARLIGGGTAFGGAEGAMTYNNGGSATDVLKSTAKGGLLGALLSSVEPLRMAATARMGQTGKAVERIANSGLGKDLEASVIGGTLAGIQPDATMEDVLVGALALGAGSRITRISAMNPESGGEAEYVTRKGEVKTANIPPEFASWMRDYAGGKKTVPDPLRLADGKLDKVATEIQKYVKESPPDVSDVRLITESTNPWLAESRAAAEADRLVESAAAVTPDVIELPGSMKTVDQVRADRVAKSKAEADKYRAAAAESNKPTSRKIRLAKDEARQYTHEIIADIAKSDGGVDILLEAGYTKKDIVRAIGESRRVKDQEVSGFTLRSGPALTPEEMAGMADSIKAKFRAAVDSRPKKEKGQPFPVNVPIRENPLDLGSLSFMETGKLDDFLDVAFGGVSGMRVGDLSQEFIDSLDGIEDVSPAQYSMGGRNYFIQGITGELGGGPERHILWPNRKLDESRRMFAEQWKIKIADIAQKHGLIGMNPGAKRRSKSVGKLAESDYNSLDQAQRKIVDEFRELFNSLRIDGNKGRRASGRDEIAYVKDYIPHVRETSWTDKFSEPYRHAQAPDFIKSKEYFNPRAKERTGALEEYETDIVKLLSDYVDVISKDIFNTAAIMHNRAHAKAFRERGLENIASQLDEYTNVVYGGRRPWATKKIDELTDSGFARAARGAGLQAKRNLNRAVFPFNWTWNIFTQTLSANNTYARYGGRNYVRGLATSLSPEFNRWANQYVYSVKTKAHRASSLTTEGTSGPDSMLLNDRLARHGMIDTVAKHGSFLSTFMENRLSMHGAAAAYHRGVQIGLTGRDLIEYTGDGASKTQSMYNFEDMPGLLQSADVKSYILPFSTYSFEMMNTVREIGAVRESQKWRTGHWKTYGRESAEGKSLINSRMKILGRFLIGIVVQDQLRRAAGLDGKYGPASFIPLWGIMTGTAGLLQIRATKQFWDAAKKFLEDGDMSKMRRWLLTWSGAPGGITWNKWLNSIEAHAREDDYETVEPAKSSGRKTQPGREAKPARTK